ncbi:MAG: PD-(D/E)XK motif protein [Proteobacteria bacterium]|nr:PD-(D/E)XK motif protein [Pseudomonadota bacterium]MBU1585516.1 PD-(D/E)XK motif protein [Pseudomonadota bacterium]MBU2455007.1 PD-(D/E)XK motif protein [Pseudomonadota bacterium]
MNNPWEEIQIPSHDILYRIIDSEHPLRLLRARDTYGRFLFIYEFSHPDHIPDKFPELNGIDIHLQGPDQSSAGNYMLLIVLKDNKEWQIFLSLCNDLVSSTKALEKQTEATLIILRRLKRWQDFLQRARSGLLPEKEIKGLIGELLFIKRHLIPAFGAGTAIQFWQGPEDAPQDFNVHDCAVEVKCQLGTTTPVVRVSSADQLCSQLSETYLYVITLGKSDVGTKVAVNLPSLISDIRNQLESDSPAELERFNDLLYQTGYIELEEYKRFNYIPASEKMFAVENDFPRICSEDLIPGVERVTYNINLFDCEPFSASPDWMKLL